MEDASIKIPFDDWRLSKIPKAESAYAVVWESLRCIEKPAHNEIQDLILNIVHYRAATSDWFQRFCRREQFRPLKLLAWLRFNIRWPDETWRTVSADILNEMEKFQIFPALIHDSQTLRDRYSSRLHSELDFLSYPIVHAIASNANGSISSDRTLTEFMECDLYRICGAMGVHNLLINRQQYTRKQLVHEFEKWLEATWPENLQELQSGGRIEPKAWLTWISAYKLWQAAAGNPIILQQWKAEFVSEYSSTEKSIDWVAKKFHDTILSQLIPDSHLPPRP